MQNSSKHQNKLYQQYVASLQKQNQAKNNQTKLLYQQIAQITKENQRLMQQAQENRRKMQVCQALAEQKVIQAENTNYELQNKLQQLQSLLQQYKQTMISLQDHTQLKNLLQTKNKELQTAKKNNKHLEQQNQSLEKEKQAIKQKFHDYEQKKNKYIKRIKQLQQTNEDLHKALELAQGNQSSFSKLDIDKLIKDNNTLIQKIRLLQKEKNQYYSELKSVSPIREKRTEQRKSTTTSKSQHWNIMQEKINAIRNQNEHLKANLALR